MTFEQSLSRLQEIVKLLESGETYLSDSLDLYKEAVELSVSCKKELEDAKLQVKIIEDLDNN